MDLSVLMSTVPVVNSDDVADSRAAALHRAAIDWLNRHPDSRGFRNYFYIRLAALTHRFPGERVTIRRIVRIARPALRRERTQVDIHLYASDLHASARFYEAVGFDLVYDDEDPFGNPPCYVGHLGPTQILLMQATPKLSVTRGLRLGFRLDDLEGAAQRLTAAEIAFGRPLPKNFVLAHDPDGNRISIKERHRRR